MSELEKLRISGIRSFSSNDHQVIRFHTPLTLIVGYNGSGKTTIIECLKYATTGELPPNSKGGAFIHDPNIVKEKEVLAQVKLQFKAMSGTTMVVTRSLSLTVKKTTRQQKTLEGNLTTRGNERASISSRVAELDQIMPQYIGVSKAVLDNVIFCHQEESLWPMSEPSVLKKKFDEIFEALKYTKAIDNIKQLRKKQNEELAKYKIIEQHAKEDKEKATKNEKRSIKLQDDIETLREECTKLSSEMSNRTNLADQTWQKAESYSRVLASLEAKNYEARSKKVTIDDLKAHLKEVSESDEWLESTLEQFEERLIQYREHENSGKEDYMELKQQIEDLRQKQSDKQVERGQFESEKAQYERHIADRKDITRTVAGRHNLRGFDSLSDDREFEDFIRKLQKILKEASTSLQQAKEENTRARDDARSRLNQLTQRKSALQDNKNSARSQISSNDRAAREIQSRMDQIDMDEGRKAVIESRIDDIQQQLHKSRQSADTASWERSLSDANAQLRTHEEEHTRLNQELVQSTRQAGELARLDHLKKEFKDRKHSLEVMSGTHGERITQLVGDGWEAHSVDKRYQDALRERSDELDNVKREHDSISRELEQTEYALRQLRTQLKGKESESKLYAQKLRDIIDDKPSEYDDVLDRKRNRFKQLKEGLESYDGLERYFNSCMEVLEKNQVCRTCLRQFSPGKEIDKARKHLANLISKAQQGNEKQQLVEAEDEFNLVRDAGVHYENWKRLHQKEIPSLRKEETDVDSRRVKLLNRIEKHDEVVQNRTEAKNELESLGRNVTNMGKAAEEARSYQSQIEELSAKKSSQQLSRTLDEIQTDIAAIGEKTRASKQVISRLTNEREQSRAHMSNLEIERSQARNELTTANFQLDKKTTHASRIEEYRKLNQQQRELVEKADADIENIAPELDKAEAKYSDICERGDSRERNLDRERIQISESLQSLNLANSEIKSYVERGGLNQLSNCQRELKSMESQMARLDKDQEKVVKEIKKIEQQLQDSEATKRQYSDNLRYRHEVRELNKIHSEIEELAAKDAEVDRTHFQEESKRLRNEYHTLSAQREGKMGEMKSKDVQLRELIADWETDYKDAASRYKESHIKVETTKAAVEDLGRYGGALDKAIMKYHSLKMEEINRIIEELWQRTYRGTDVDSVLIRSDNENAKGNRSYNYRVCMVKSDVEMDMRGRCSAGQKVLASIIIRLALAECFGVNCGLIALDEPTTNLDRDNIQSLAQSLHEIIKNRERQKNFQLIVITHDEDFLRHMQCGDFADYYYRVSRDASQNSVIERQDISEVL
ncbi:MAG: hypothetical protein Q9160_006822 [Pyrenula sp. 1 TL-2023]